MNCEWPCAYTDEEDDDQQDEIELIMIMKTTVSYCRCNLYELIGVLLSNVPRLHKQAHGQQALH